METKHVRIVLIGPPGVGKGTQAALIEQRMGAKILSSGLIFRKEIEAMTDLGRLAQSYINRGELVPNGITIEMISKRLRNDEVRRSGFVLDGFPRTIRQAEALEQLLTDMDFHLDEVVSLSVPDHVLLERLSGRLGCTKCDEIYHAKDKPPKREGLCDKCNSPLFVREDDKPETILERLRVFRENTKPVIDFYRDKGILREVDASQDLELVYNEITNFDAHAAS